MADQDLLSKRQKEQIRKNKFLFDQHNFDDGPVSMEPEPEEEPPPSFSEEELAKAGEDGYQKGFRDGKHESDTSRERHVVDLLGRISEQFSVLFAAEAEREERFENEVVHLCRAIFEKAFPTLIKNHGMDELTKIIHSVLKTHSEVPEIIVEVAPDYVEATEEKLKKMAIAEGYSGQYSVKGNVSCKEGDCRMQWKDGGAKRNAGFLAEEILKQLEDTLADKPLLHDNGSSEDGNDDDAESLIETDESNEPPTEPEMEQ